MTKKKNLTDTQMTMEEAGKLLPIALDANKLYRDFIGLTNIERAQEEDFVLKRLFVGDSKNKIVEDLKAKHPDMKFSSDDFEKFLARNQDVVKQMGKEVTLSARRHLKARADCEESLAGLALYVQDMILRMKAEGDHTNEVAAVRAFNATLENYMKITGLLGQQQEGGKVINIINQVSEHKSKLREQIHNANFSDITEDDGKV